MLEPIIIVFAVLQAAVEKNAMIIDRVIIIGGNLLVDSYT